MQCRSLKVEGVTVHGFRSTFRVWAANVQREVAEMSLAHRVGSEVELAYQRSDRLDKRGKLMEGWPNYVEGTPGSVIDLALSAGK